MTKQKKRCHRKRHERFKWANKKERQTAVFQLTTVPDKFEWYQRGDNHYLVLKGTGVIYYKILHVGEGIYSFKHSDGYEATFISNIAAMNHIHKLINK